MAQINFNDKNNGDYLTPQDVNNIKSAVNTNEGLLSNGTVSGYYDSNNQWRYNHHFIPATNSQYDLGSAEYKIRHLYLSNNSMWVGEESKIEASSGSLKTKKRNKDKVPYYITGVLNQDPEFVYSFLNVDFPHEITLKGYEEFAQSINPNATLLDIFPPETSDNYRASDYIEDYQHGAPAFPYLTQDQFHTFDATGGGMWDLDFNVYFLNKPLLYIIGDSNSPIAFQLTNIPADLAFYETTLFLYEFGPNQSLKFLINGQFIQDIGYSNTGFNASVFMDFKLIKNHLGQWSCKIGPTSPNLIRP